MIIIKKKKKKKKKIIPTSIKLHLLYILHIKLEKLK